MLSKKFTYKDYFGKDRNDEKFFNLSRSELLDMSVDDSFVRMLTKIVESNDQKEIYNTFKKFVLKAYGEISEDGTGFEKSEELSRKFSQTIAYDMLMSELTSDDKAAAEFINALIPEDLRKEMAAVETGNKAIN